MSAATAPNRALTTALPAPPAPSPFFAVGAWLRRYGAAVPLALVVLAALVGPLVLPYDPLVVRLPDRVLPPGSATATGPTAWLGTDQVGKDVLAQVFQGARVSLLVGLATVTIAGTIGLVAGVAAGYWGGAVDSILMRVADVQLAFPSILFAILIASVIGPSVANVIITLSITQWVIFARVARATTLVARQRDYVSASRALGARDAWLLRKHIVPSLIAPFTVLAALEMGLAIIAEASLSFLGLGTPPAVPSWGLTIANGRDYLDTAWWISTMPGIALCIFVLCLGTLGDQLRRGLDPRARGHT